mmetsp:Transcript_22142/g.87843  ORF Transcript_22142/g.87843 Transcript_22142/m.87843 type:complete len:247 (-) Transcript_22142:115-855(-)
MPVSASPGSLGDLVATVAIGLATVVAFGVVCVRRYRAQTARAAKTPEKPWVASAKKGSNSYYFAHHTRLADGLDATDYRMNGPRRLDPRTKRPLDDAAAATTDAARPLLPTPVAHAATTTTTTSRRSGSSSSSEAPTRQKHRLTQYSWADTASHVTIYVEYPADWASDDLDTSAELTGDGAGVAIEVARRDGRDTPYALVLSRLRAPVTAVTKKQTKKRLTVKLAKSVQQTWDTLILNSAHVDEVD